MEENNCTKEGWEKICFIPLEETLYDYDIIYEMIKDEQGNPLPDQVNGVLVVRKLKELK